jgi:hypothetical protein
VTHALPDDPGAYEERIDHLVADQIEPARVKALDELGEGRRAMSVAMRLVGPRARVTFARQFTHVTAPDESAVLVPSPFAVELPE